MSGSPSGGTNPTASTANDSLQKLKFNNLSIPSIPSRFLTPVLKFDLYEKDGLEPDKLNRSYAEDGYDITQYQDSSIESILVAKVARLTNDGSTLGPGSYNIDQSSRALAQSPKGAIKWTHSRSQRDEHFVKSFTDKVVGPGSYENAHKIDRKIQNPTIPRTTYQARTFVGFQKRKAPKNKGSIKDNFEEESSDEDDRLKITPGPGEYLKHHHTSYIGQSPIIHRHPQHFGTVVRRFREKPVGCPLGPGQYMSQNPQARAD